MTSPAARRRDEDAAVLVLLGVVSFAAVAKGAFFVFPLRVLETGVIAAAVAMLWSRRRGSLAPLAAAAAVAVTVVASGAANDSLKLALEQSLFLLVLGIAAWVVSKLPSASAQIVLGGVIAAGIAVAATSYIGVAIHAAPWALRLNNAWRGSSTITYANATACFAIMTAALVITTSRTAKPWSQAAVAICLLGAGATLSRAAVSSALVAVVVLALVGDARRLRPYFASGVAAAIGFVGLVPSFAREQPPKPLLAGAAIVVAAAVLVLQTRPGWTKRWLGVGVALLALEVVVVSGIASWHPLTARIADAGSVGGRRMSWSAFVELGWRKPVLGQGPSTFGVHTGRGGSALVFAHNEYVQAFMETGMVGLVVVLGAIAALGYLAWRAPRPGGVVVGAVVCAFAVTDFVWNVPLIPLCAALVLGDALRSDAARQGVGDVSFGAQLDQTRAIP